MFKITVYTSPFILLNRSLYQMTNMLFNLLVAVHIDWLYDTSSELTYVHL